MPTPMTTDDYMSFCGDNCPNCRHGSVRRGLPERRGGRVETPCWCSRCSADWREVYTLTNYVNLKENP